MTCCSQVIVCILYTGIVYKSLMNTGIQRIDMLGESRHYARYSKSQKKNMFYKFHNCQYKFKFLIAFLNFPSASAFRKFL